MRQSESHRDDHDVHEALGGGGGGGLGLKSQLELGSLGKSLDKNVVVFICRTLLYCTAQHRTAKRDRSYVDTSRFLTGC